MLQSYNLRIYYNQASNKSMIAKKIVAGRTSSNFLIKRLPRKNSIKKHSHYIEQQKNKSIEKRMEETSPTFRKWTQTKVQTKDQAHTNKEFKSMVILQFEQKKSATQSPEVREARSTYLNATTVEKSKTRSFSKCINEIYLKIDKSLARKEIEHSLKIGSYQIKEPQHNVHSTTFIAPQIERPKRHKDPIPKISTYKGTSELQYFLCRRPSNNANIKSSEEIKKRVETDTQCLYVPKIDSNSGRPNYFVFGNDNKSLHQQRGKKNEESYKDFLWKVNFSNNLFVVPPEQNTSFKAFIGKGNNSYMISGILKRRNCWVLVDKPKDVNFIWTQLKINDIFKQQRSIQIQQPMKQESSCTMPSINANFYQPNGHQKIFNKVDLENWSVHMKKNRKYETTLSNKTYMKRLPLLNGKHITKIDNPQLINLHNHFAQNGHLGNKKALFYNLKNLYQLQGKDVFDIIPLTYHLSNGTNDNTYNEFLAEYQMLEERHAKNLWIIKPGENSNQGNGITVTSSLDEIKLRLKLKEKDKKTRTIILQKYIERPLLYKDRKFDIRHFMLITSFNGAMKAYWYPQGYLRTSSQVYSLKAGKNAYMHLTNDAIQSKSPEYGKYQRGNKVSYEDFQKYLSKSLNKKHHNKFFEEILPKMKEMTIDVVKSTYSMLDTKRKQHNFQLWGMDFMIDSELKPWLIEVNTNPCLELSCPLLARVLPELIQNTFRICVDPFFMPTSKAIRSRLISDDPLQENKFELIFDERINGVELEQLFKDKERIDCKMGCISEDAEIFESDGDEDWEN